MGWNRTGKFGIHSGKTLRRNPTRKGAFVNQRLQWGLPRSRNEFAVVKEVNFGSSLRNVDPKSVKFDFEDGGLPLEEDSLIYSLNKHKRWLLPDMLKENVRQLVDEENDGKKLDSTTKNSIKNPKKRSKQNTDSTVRVSVVERHSASEADKFSPDCIGVTSNVVNPSSDPERKPGKCYAHVGDLKPKVSGNDVEVYYEFLSPFPKKAWPSHRQCRRYRRNSVDEVIGLKAKKKGKGRKNKWNQPNSQWDENLKEFNKCASLGGCDDDDVSQEYVSEPFNSEFTFPIGACIRDAIQAKNKKNPEEFNLELCKDHTPTLSNPSVYGKGQAVYIDNDTEMSNLSDIKESTYNQIASKSVPLSKDEKVRINLLTKDIVSDNLSNEFGSNYVEGAISPRKFIIKVDLNETVPNNDMNDFFLLFELPDTPCKQDTTRATVAILLPKTELIPNIKDERNFELCILQNDRPLTVKTIVNVVTEKISSQVTSSSKNVSQKKSAMKVPVEFIQHVCKLESEVCDLRKATQYALSLGSAETIGATCSALSKAENSTGDGKLCCEICYLEEDMDQCIDAANFTRLLNCSHQFCNECVASYITSCVEAGQSQITCPHYNCKTIIPEPLIWSSTNTELYQKHRKITQESLVNTNPCLRHCPAADCPQLAYVTPFDGKPSDSVPVLCNCGMVWCFSCQKEAHWPASCKEAEAFHEEFQEHREYIKMLRLPGLVSSVHVKKCPFCHHPIEKGLGCPHMSCPCGQQFCWECLCPYFDHDWDLCRSRRKELEEVVFTPVGKGSANHEKYMKIAFANALERNGKNFSVFKQLTERAKRVENAHDFLTENPKTSTCRLVRNYIEKNIASLVEDAFHFKNLAHFVLENTAAVVAVSKTPKLVGKALQRDVEVLEFIIQRCNEVLFQPALLFDEEKLTTVRELLKHGEESVRNINRLVQAGRKN